MGKQRRRFTREFKVEAVRLALAGPQPRKVVADELGLKAETLYRWIQELQSDPAQSFPGNGQLKDRDRELEQLRREVTRLQAENTFLKKVSAYFARVARRGRGMNSSGDSTRALGRSCEAPAGSGREPRSGLSSRPFC